MKRRVAVRISFRINPILNITQLIPRNEEKTVSRFVANVCANETDASVVISGGISLSWKFFILCIYLHTYSSV